MEIDFCPRWILTRLRVPERSQHHLAMLISTLVVLLLVPIIPHVPHFCLMKKLLGIPCPGCGISHSLMAALRFDLAKAWFFNPAGIAVALLFCYQIVARPVAIALPQAAAAVSSISRYGSNITVILLFLVWSYRVF
ncbi:MAG: DUF2752 domain-containing protein [Acidobacteriia bacterium]|nr:DUF2752 domain-containing protein [Terriglobia bacterium]